MAVKKRFLAALVSCAVPLGSLGAASAAEPAGGGPQGFTMRLPDPLGHHAFWIGAMCQPADPALRAQLNLADDRGLVVVNIMPESPADKAGLKKFDVLTAIDGKVLSSLYSLITRVEQAGEKELKLDIIRGGKQQTLVVTPAKRPDRDPLVFNSPLGGNDPHAGDPRMLKEKLDRLQTQLEQMREKLPAGEAQRIEQWMERMRRGDNEPLRMQVFGPGVVMQPIQMPAGVSVSISRNGNEPAQVKVKRGEESWEVTEKDLDKLPADLRGPIEQMLAAKGAIAIQSGTIQSGTMQGGGAGGTATATATASGSGDNVQIEIKTDASGDKPIVVDAGTPGGNPGLTEEVTRLRKQVEALQQQLKNVQQQAEKLRAQQQQLPKLPKAPPKKDQI